MDARHFISTLVACSLLAGCQSGGNTELMERELRLQEDRIYYLEDQLAHCCEEIQARDQELAGLRTGPTKASPKPASRSSSAPPAGMPMDTTLPKVELDLPSQPAPPNSLPSLFDPVPSSSENEAGTAMRIVRPQPRPPLLAAGESAAQPHPPRMRFASSLQEEPTRVPARTMMQWSAAPGDRASDEPATPRTATAAGAGSRRPQWSPYR